MVVVHVRACENWTTRTSSCMMCQCTYQEESLPMCTAIAVCRVSRVRVRVRVSYSQASRVYLYLEWLYTRLRAKLAVCIAYRPNRNHSLNRERLAQNDKKRFITKMAPLWALAHASLVMSTFTLHIFKLYRPNRCCVQADVQ